MWVPIPLGSNRAWAWSVLEVYAFALLGAWLVAWALGGARVGEPVKRAWPAWIVLALWLGLQALHVLPMPAGWVSILSPEAARMQSLVADLGVHRESMTLSVAPQDSRVALLKSLAYAAIFFLVLALVNRRSRVETLARVLVYAALVHAVYAVLMHVSNEQSEYFGMLIPHGDSASGTY